MPIKRPAQYWIDHLKLQPHPEGGFYKETYRSKESVPAGIVLRDSPGPRSFSTAIYFLLRAQDKSLFHRIKSDELWHYHAGDCLSIYILTKDGLITHALGKDIDEGQQLQVTVPANHWFGASLDRGAYTLSSCTVSPGFDFQDFEMAQRSSLLNEFPEQETLINFLSNEGD